MPTITICSSVSFYKNVAAVKTKLQNDGYTVIIPAVAQLMQDSGNFNVNDYKPWFADAKDYHKKAELMHDHFDEVEKADAILVLNYQKHGVDNYIGGNVLMEMALAFHLKRPVFILNEIPKESTFLEEIEGLLPIILHGKLENFDKEFKGLDQT